MAERKPRKDRNLDKASWIAAARKMLIEKGIAGISLRQLAEELGATTGAFYWQFANLEELLEDVRQDWAQRNTAPFTRAIEAAGDDGWEQYLAYVGVLLKEEEYIPQYDNAIRDWAHSSKRTAEVLKEIEALRIQQLHQVFLAMGFTGRAAQVRAYVTYFHQTGYNAMQVSEPREERLLNIPYYAEVLADRADLLDLQTAEAVSEHFAARDSET
ncbi:TetR/AcrR family transcriptional regulator [Ruegeria pomeroyi]|uniref:TetR/AcrR family transcriptional regulator n=1 Tax=Ruegeria alba TaxID=2916756 RepID=A0ABS9NU84_9RHOB|nr:MULTISPECIES: TetR/AcrR family transcriptional regulator [Ruegeria]MCE8507474.1 TetR/AcrR family transcriptional regulator [Ruegeria pomeroyi]MCE8516472.1 TetR/AcrR family transcriptional regulator [Ruegeria pomeroyi]MCE8526069.1 TetR/AcrR family transcriptional regulator [Ruegeria pomeroyi]MCE8554088.1 TetR/AcrR family transcriptional regulator [Ruegeria pomeroyi]MCG6557786.1 TetR/AcrR family transcriptional regulator [Ruegeria alba]